MVLRHGLYLPPQLMLKGQIDRDPDQAIEEMQGLCIVNLVIWLLIFYHTHCVFVSLLDKEVTRMVI